jgi:hypothetical protein
MGYSVSGSVVTATADVPGTGPNSYTLATSDSSAFTLSGAHLTGGTANTGATTVGSMSAGPFIQSGNYVVTLLTGGATFSVVDPHGEPLPNGTVGTAYTNAQINFTLTTNGTAGDQFVLTGNPTATGVYKVSVASATDGSQNPAAIAADFIDPTSGNVTAGVYLAGEFNANALVVDPSLTPASVKASLRSLGIFVKYPVSAADPT